MPSSSNNGTIYQHVRIAVPPKDVLKGILERPLSLDKDTLQLCERVVDEGLTADEVELAAQSSYVYWAWEHLDEHGTTDDGLKQRYRRAMAIREVRRQYSNRKKSYTKLLQKVQQALAVRKKDQIHLLRVCCNLGKSSKTVSQSSSSSSSSSNHPTYISVPLTRAEHDHCVNLDRLIRSELQRQTNVILELDATTIAGLRLPRSQPWVDKVESEAYPWGALYLTERALAMSEVQAATALAKKSTNSTGDAATSHLHIILDTYQAVHAPRLSAMTSVLQTMQLLYPERLGKALVVHPPLWLRTIVTLLQPFLSPHTAERVVMITSSSSSKTAGTDEERLAAWIRSQGSEAIDAMMQQQIHDNALYYEPYTVTYKEDAS